MPIREFKCMKCEESFEILILKAEDKDTLSCPKCGSSELTPLISSFSLKGGSSSICSSCSTTSCKTCGL